MKPQVGLKEPVAKTAPLSTPGADALLRRGSADGRDPLPGPGQTPWALPAAMGAGMALLSPHTGD